MELLNLNEPTTPQVDDRTAEKLAKRQDAVINLITNMIADLPLMAQTMIRLNYSTLMDFIKSMTWEQSEELLNKITDTVEFIKSGDADVEP